MICTPRLGCLSPLRTGRVLAARPGVVTSQLHLKPTCVLQPLTPSHLNIAVLLAAPLHRVHFLHMTHGCPLFVIAACFFRSIHLVCWGIFFKDVFFTPYQQAVCPAYLRLGSHLF